MLLLRVIVKIFATPLSEVTASLSKPAIVLIPASTLLEVPAILAILAHAVFHFSL